MKKVSSQFKIKSSRAIMRSETCSIIFFKGIIYSLYSIILTINIQAFTTRTLAKGTSTWIKSKTSRADDD